jgi:hypothetical protein
MIVGTSSNPEQQVWYTSLAFGGFGSSDADVQSAHLLTEQMLRK